MIKSRAPRRPDHLIPCNALYRKLRMRAEGADEAATAAEEAADLTEEAAELATEAPTFGETDWA
jgi:hypothetical protein